MGLRVHTDFACVNAVRALQYSIAMSGRDVGERSALYVPEAIEPECTRIIRRRAIDDPVIDDPTTIFDLAEARGEPPTVRAKGSVQSAVPRIARVAPKPPPIPPRRSAVTPISLDASYEAAMRLFR